MRQIDRQKFGLREEGRAPCDPQRIERERDSHDHHRRDQQCGCPTQFAMERDAVAKDERILRKIQRNPAQKNDGVQMIDHGQGEAGHTHGHHHGKTAHARRGHEAGHDEEKPGFGLRHIARLCCCRHLSPRTCDSPIVAQNVTAIKPPARCLHPGSRVRVCEGR